MKGGSTGNSAAKLLPGGVHPWHAFDESKAGYYSQLQLKRCVEDRNPLLPIMEDYVEGFAIERTTPFNLEVEFFVFL